MDGFSLGEILVRLEIAELSNRVAHFLFINSINKKIYNTQILSIKNELIIYEKKIRNRII